MFEAGHALESILRKPALASTALLTIALGIGANTAVYTVVHAVLLEPLPFRQPKALVQVWETHPDFHNLQVSVPDYRDWKKSVRGLDLAAYTFQAMNKGTLLGQGDPLEVQATNASAELFPLLGIGQVVGHAYSTRQEQAKEPVALISERLWRSKFSADPGVLGRAVHLDTAAFTVIGVVRQAQAFPAWADVWIPLSFIDPATESTRKFHPLEVIGRLRPGVSVPQAEAETETVSRRLSAAYPATNGKIGVFVLPLMEAVTGEVRPALLAVWIAVGLVLLIACVNLAHLMLAWSLNCRRDIAVRLALGASRLAALRGFFLETLILSVTGGILGIFAAAAALPVLKNLAQGRIPRLEAVKIDGAVLLFGVLLSCLVAFLFALPACWRVMRADLTEAISLGDMRGSSGRRSWLSSLLMCTEVALSLAVLLAATMLVRSFALTLQTDPGFRPEGLLAVNVPLADRDWNKSYDIFRNRIAPELGRIAGVKEVAAVNSVPMSLGATEHTRYATRFGIVGRTFDPGQFPTAQTRWSTSNYLHVLGVPLETGRFLGDIDYNQARCVVNEVFARRFFPEENAVGQKLLLGVVTPHPQEVEIVGVVGSVREFGLDQAPEPTMYSVTVSPRMDVLVKASGNPTPLEPLITTAMRRAEPQGAIGPVRTLSDYVDSSLARQRFALSLMTVFAALATLLCMVGIYGVFGYSVTRRVREFGIRSAIGAEKRDLVKLILRECLAVVIPGLIAGMLISAACSQFLQVLLFRVSPTDKVSYTIAVVCILILCLGSAIIPARRAAKVDPVCVLREQ